MSCWAWEHFNFIKPKKNKEFQIDPCCELVPLFFNPIIITFDVFHYKSYKAVNFLSPRAQSVIPEFPKTTPIQRSACAMTTLKNLPRIFFLPNYHPDSFSFALATFLGPSVWIGKSSFGWLCLLFYRMNAFSSYSFPTDIKQAAGLP